MAGQAIAINIQTPSEPQTGEGLRQLFFDPGVEPSLTVNEAAAVLRFYRTFTIPLSVFARE